MGRKKEADACLEKFRENHPGVELKHETENICTYQAFDLESDQPQNQSEAVISPLEEEWRKRACDYEKSFYGHCNITTDIKEAIFFGKDEQFIAAGSDDGNLFIWDRSTTNLIRVLRGDDSIVNCVQAHPHICLLATSGIESCVKLWAPKPKTDVPEKDQGINIHKASKDNQHRMNVDPLAIMLMQMNSMVQMADDPIMVYGNEESDEGASDGDGNPPNMECRSS